MRLTKHEIEDHVGVLQTPRRSRGRLGGLGTPPIHLQCRPVHPSDQYTPVSPPSPAIFDLAHQPQVDCVPGQSRYRSDHGEWMLAKDRHIAAATRTHWHVS